jgi:mono/diheme cytochrome c family protein
MKKMMLFLGVAAMLTVFSVGVLHGKEKNPYAGDPSAVREGEQLFGNHCQICHGMGGKGDVCPNLTTRKKKYGDTDEDLYQTISKGRPEGMPTWQNILGPEKIWKLITYIRSIEK